MPDSYPFVVGNITCPCIYCASTRNFPTTKECELCGIDVVSTQEYAADDVHLCMLCDFKVKSTFKVGECKCCGASDTPVQCLPNGRTHFCVSCHTFRKCCNFDFCGFIGPKWKYLYCYNGSCLECYKSFGPGVKLQMKKTDGDDSECPICYSENTKMVKFPAKDCINWFCIDCCKTMIWRDPSRYHLNPILFGCPPCPNQCENPEKGKQCDCTEYEALKKEWKTIDHEGYHEWQQKEQYSIKNTPDSYFGEGKCALCRRMFIPFNDFDFHSE